MEEYTDVQDCLAFAAQLRATSENHAYILDHLVAGDSSRVIAYADRCARAARHLEAVIVKRIGRGRSQRRLLKDTWYRNAKYAGSYAAARAATLAGL